MIRCTVGHEEQGIFSDREEERRLRVAGGAAKVLGSLVTSALIGENFGNWSEFHLCVRP